MSKALVSQTASIKTPLRDKNSNLKGDLKKDLLLYLMLVPGIIYFIIFKYMPMWGVIIAFMDYMPFAGMLKSEWVGFANFTRFFTDEAFLMLFRNTIILAIMNLVFFFPLPIIVALMLNEIRSSAYKRFVQSLIYVPHFMSWVVIIGIVYVMFSPQTGLITEVIDVMFGARPDFLLSNDWFRPMIIMQVIWRETGWGTIIFLAALAGVDINLYEAATIDGASRFKQLLHITLPSIKSTIVILLILRLGNFMDSGFEQIFLNLNALNKEVGEVFDTYVYMMGISKAQYSYSAAVGLFKSLIGLFMVFSADIIAKKFGEEGIY